MLNAAGARSGKMNWRWLIFDYADPELPISLWGRLRISFKMIPIWRLPRSVRRGRYIFALAMVPFGLMPMLPFLIARPGIPTGLLMYLPVPFAFLVWAGGCFLYGLTCRREYMHRLRVSGFEVCLQCGYWLRGLGDDVKRCPECGAAREAMPATPNDPPEEL